MNAQLRASLFLLCVILICLGCTRPRPYPTEGARLEEAEEAPVEQPTPIHFTVGHGDELQITVWNIPELNQTVTVEPSGIISVPIAGNVAVTGKTITDVAETLEERFGEYYVDPDVTVSVKTYRSNKMTVLGEVNKPGLYVMDRETRLMEALAMAGDMTGNAEPRTVALIRGDLDSPEIYLLDIKSLISRGDLKQNMAIRQGDIIYVPQSLIASVDTFFQHLYTAIRPVVELERGIAIWPSVEDTFEGDKADKVIVVR